MLGVGVAMEFIHEKGGFFWKLLPWELGLPWCLLMKGRLFLEVVSFKFELFS